MQFHPEFDADVMRSYIAARAHLVRDEGGDPERLAAGVKEHTHGRPLLEAFVRQFVVG